MGLYKFLDNKRTLWFFLILVAVLIALSIVTGSAYRKVGLQGEVYVWNNAPAGAVSQAYTFDKSNDEAENWVPPAGMDVSPLGGAYVRFVAEYRDGNQEKSLAITAKTGKYAKNTSRWKVTGDITLNIEVSKDGYQSVNATAVNKSGLLYGGTPSVGYFILVPEPAAAN
jgi:hypothetical protein